MFCSIRNLNIDKYLINMRLHLHTTANSTPIPFNYQQKMTGVLHKWLGSNNDEHGKLSLYSFSWLQGTKICGQGLNCPNGASFFLSFHDNQRLKDVLDSIRTLPEMFCGIYVNDVVIEDNPDFSTIERFNLGSPILIKRQNENTITEFFYDSPEAGKLLEDTLKSKMRMAGIPDDETLQIEFDLSYERKKKKLVWYEGISSKVSICPVIIKGSPVTKQFAWNVGLGNCTGIGFGSIY